MRGFYGRISLLFRLHFLLLKFGHLVFTIYVENRAMILFYKVIFERNKVNANNAGCGRGKPCPLS